MDKPDMKPLETMKRTKGEKKNVNSLHANNEGLQLSRNLPMTAPIVQLAKIKPSASRPKGLSLMEMEVRNMIKERVLLLSSHAHDAGSSKKDQRYFESIDSLLRVNQTGKKKIDYDQNTQANKFFDSMEYFVELILVNFYDVLDNNGKQNKTQKKYGQDAQSMRRPGRFQRGPRRQGEQQNDSRALFDFIGPRLVNSSLVPDNKSHKRYLQVLASLQEAFQAMPHETQIESETAVKGKQAAGSEPVGNLFTSNYQNRQRVFREILRGSFQT
jgi:hypothetical protein